MKPPVSFSYASSDSTSRRKPSSPAHASFRNTARPLSSCSKAAWYIFSTCRQRSLFTALFPFSFVDQSGGPKSMSHGSWSQCASPAGVILCKSAASIVPAFQARSSCVRSCGGGSVILSPHVVRIRLRSGATYQTACAFAIDLNRRLHGFFSAWLQFWTAVPA